MRVGVGLRVAVGSSVGVGYGVYVGGGAAVGVVVLFGSPHAMANAITISAERPITRIKKPPHGQVARLPTPLPCPVGPFGVAVHTLFYGHARISRSKTLCVRRSALATVQYHPKSTENKPYRGSYCVPFPVRSTRI